MSPSGEHKCDWCGSKVPYYADKWPCELISCGRSVCIEELEAVRDIERAGRRARLRAY